jgi:hypothetical protein
MLWQLTFSRWLEGKVGRGGGECSLERLKMGGPCWLLKLRQKVSHGVHMKGVLPWLVRWACHGGTRDICIALAALVSPVHCCCLLHNGGFCNNCTPKRCLHISVHFQSKCTIKRPFHTTATWKAWNYEIMKTTSLCSAWKKELFDNIILTQNHAWHITQSGWNNNLV